MYEPESDDSEKPLHMDGTSRAVAHAAARAAEAARSGWRQRDALSGQASDRVRSWADTSASAADAVIEKAVSRTRARPEYGQRVVGTAAECSVPAWDQGRTSFAPAPTIPVVERRLPVRPREVTIAAVFGVVASVFLAIAAVLVGVKGSSSLRLVGRVLRDTGTATDIDALATTGNISTTVANLIVAMGITTAIVAIVSFGVYVFMILLGRGLSRWVALATLIAVFLVISPLSPFFSTCFLLSGAASVTFAFLPGSGVWFTYMANIRKAAKTSPAHP